MWRPGTTKTRWRAPTCSNRAAERDGPVGPLHGLPITVKDWIDVAGLPCTGGYEECRDRMPEADATVVARMRAAGAIVLAKTTVQEDTALFGPVRNPRDPTRSPGFSSSGSAAAVAGGGCPLALGSDSGGSIRLPAAWCGAPALKPSAGLVPTTGHFPRVGERGDGRTVIGPIGARVRTLVDVLAVIAGPDDRDAGCSPVALGAVDDVVVAALRIGWSLGEERWTASAATCDAVQAAVARLATMGATIVGEVPQYLDEALDVTKRYWARCKGELPGSDAEQHLVDWDRYRVRMLRATDGVDAIVMPATPSVARPCTGRNGRRRHLHAAREPDRRAGCGRARRRGRRPADRSADRGAPLARRCRAPDRRGARGLTARPMASTRRTEGPAHCPRRAGSERRRALERRGQAMEIRKRDHRTVTPP